MALKQVFHFKLTCSRADKVYSNVMDALLAKAVHLILSATSYLIFKVCELLSKVKKTKPDLPHNRIIK